MRGSATFVWRSDGGAIICLPKVSVILWRVTLSNALLTHSSLSVSTIVLRLPMEPATCQFVLPSIGDVLCLVIWYRCDSINGCSNPVTSMPQAPTTYTLFISIREILHSGSLEVSSFVCLTFPWTPFRTRTPASLNSSIKLFPTFIVSSIVAPRTWISTRSLSTQATFFKSLDQWVMGQQLIYPHASNNRIDDTVPLS